MTKKQFLEPPMIQYANVEEDWRGTDNKDRYEQIKNNPNLPYKLGDFRYKNNSRGYRCDEFDSWENHPIRVLFAGSSVAEGVGSPIETTWTKVMHGMLCKKLEQSIPFWSVAVGGTGTDHMLRYLYHEGETLRPHVVIAQMPFLERRERWHDDYWIPGSASSKKDVQILRSFLKDEYVQYQTEKNLAMIDLLMKRWNSVLLFYPEDKKFSVDYMNLKNIKQLFYGEDAVMPMTDLGRDLIHPGVKSHYGIAERLFNKSWDIIKEKINA